jgi:hypothetical protein
MPSNEQSKSDVVLDHVVYTYYIYFSFVSTKTSVSFLSDEESTSIFPCSMNTA